MARLEPVVLLGGRVGGDILRIIGLMAGLFAAIELVRFGVLPPDAAGSMVAAVYVLKGFWCLVLGLGERVWRPAAWLGAAFLAAGVWVVPWLVAVGPLPYGLPLLGCQDPAFFLVIALCVTRPRLRARVRPMPSVQVT